SSWSAPERTQATTPTSTTASRPSGSPGRACGATGTSGPRPTRPEPARAPRRARVPAALPRPDRVDPRQRDGAHRAGLRRAGHHRLEGRPWLRPGGARAAAGDLPALRRRPGRPAATTPRDGGVERRQRREPARGRLARPRRERPNLGAGGARGRERDVVGVLLPR